VAGIFSLKLSTALYPQDIPRLSKVSMEGYTDKQATNLIHKPASYFPKEEIRLKKIMNGE
jgi:hypothetical protein